jgi:hypothetical protein
MSQTAQHRRETRLVAVVAATGDETKKDAMRINGGFEKRPADSPGRGPRANLRSRWAECEKRGEPYRGGRDGAIPLAPRATCATARSRSKARSRCKLSSGGRELAGQHVFPSRADYKPPSEFAANSE